MSISMGYLEAEKNAIIAMAKEVPVNAMPSNEALSIHRAAMAVVDRFSLFLKNITDRFSSPVKDLSDASMEPVSAQFREVMAFEKAVDKANYLDLATIRVQVIPGLSVTWLELLTSWEIPVNFSVNFYDDYLNPFEKFLAISVTDPEKFNTLGTVNTIGQLDIDSHLRALTEGLKGNTKTNLRAYGECVGRNADAVEAYRKTLGFARALHKGNLSLVKGSIDNSAKMIATLSKQIKDSNLPYRLNAKTVSDLTELVYQMAKMSELYAATFTYVESQRNAMDEATKKIISVIK